MIVGTGNEAEGDALLVERILQLRHRLSDLRAGVVIKAGQDVWRACDDGDAVSGGGSRHGKRNRDVGGAVINAMKYVAMKIDQIERLTTPTDNPKKFLKYSLCAVKSATTWRSSDEAAIVAIAPQARTKQAA